MGSPRGFCGAPGDEFTQVKVAVPKALAKRNGPERPDAICVYWRENGIPAPTGTVPTKAVRCNARMAFVVSGLERLSRATSREPS